MKKLLFVLAVLVLAVPAFSQSQDVCATARVKIVVPISTTASVQLITNDSTKRIFVCHVHLVTALANNVSLVEGTGSTCGTGTAGMAGGATAATGWNLAANGGLSVGSGDATVTLTATAGDNVCLLVSAATQVSGVITYVKVIP